uniref:Pecanex-like protein n=2 Tax=Lutzomyia longipalpis TaxID=7200 RepID=A0A1B0CEQ8_LUTLO
MHDFMDSASIPHGFDKSLSSRPSVQAAILSIGRVEIADDTFGEMSRFYQDIAKLKPMPKYYKLSMNFLGHHTFKIQMDRLQLLALFDRDTGWFQVILATILTFLVSILGALVLHLGFYEDIFAFIFCFVIAGSQYSLIKSVQPDAASPIHGFNKTVSYSRPIYFCLCTLLLIGAHKMSRQSPYDDVPGNVDLFGGTIHSRTFYEMIEYILSIVLLAFPILFSLGLFPQINTFLMYFLEQVEMHVFGGNAVCNLTAAFFAVLKSILACIILYGPAYGGLIEPQGSQHVMFSIFCALLIPIAYHLSRTASDLTYVWLLIKSSIQLHSDEDEHEPSSAEKVKKSPSTESNCSSGEAVQENRSPTKEEGSSNDNKTDVNSMDTHPPQPTTVTSTSTTGQPNMLTDSELVDPLPKKMQSTVNARLKHDLLVCCVLAVVYLGLHCSTVFTVLQPDLNPVLHIIAGILGLVLHYIVPQMRKHWPWLCMSLPILRPHEFGQFEPRGAAKVMWFEKFIVYLCMLERNVLYPIVFLSALTSDSMRIVSKFGISLGTVFVVMCGLKCVRSSFSDPGSQYLILIFSVLFFRLDYTASSETFLINYFFISIIYKKTCDFLLKIQFIVTYIAPWQITWGSAFHAFAQPFSVPHSAMLFLQAGISAILSTPLNPFLGSAIFLTSYVRPIKFWERDYNTRRIDHSNTRLSSQLERDLGSDDNNLNSIFYEHLTRSLQHSLCGDLLLGRWGNVSQGDCFVLASDYLNCLVHIIELGNGLCTFQMRGLEFRGTYCQQREVEAISEGVEENRDCCCCSPGHLPFILSVNAMFSTRWLAWQVVAAQYILEGYSISDNSAVATLQVFEFRRVLITYYVKSIIYYTVQSPKLDEWLNSQAIQEALQITMERQYVDLDPVFNHNLDEDYDFRSSGITRNSFCSVYLGWIQYCYKQKRKREASNASASSVNQSQNPSDNKMGHKESKESSKNNDESSNIVTKESALVSLCLALGILARRTLATASHSSSSGVEFFLHGLHALFKGDFRITSHRDEWVFADMDLLQSVVAPAVRMSLKLHQDHFQNPDDYEDKAALYKAISIHTHELVISHEADPLWRNAVLRGVPNLLALRHVMEDGSDEYRVIRLSKRFLSFRVIKLNRECVRGLWAGQQQELIYLRNRNPERGSIQNAKQALRNIINSSCDQPIGYPIYVSPLTTSYAETNEQLCSIVGGSVSVKKIRNLIFDVWSRVRQRCREGCSSGSAIDSDMGDIQGVYYNAQVPHSVTTIGGGITGSGGGTLAYGSQNLSVSGATTRGSLASMGKPTSSTLLAGILNRDRDIEREAVRSGAKRTSSHSRISERERRATLPATSSSSSSTRDVCSKDMLMGSTNSCLKHQESLDFCTAAASSTSRGAATWKCSSRKKSLSVESRESRQKYGESSRSTAEEPPPPANIPLNKKVIIVDAGEIYDCLNLGRRIDVLWPNEEMRQSGGRSSWRDWFPQEGMVGIVRHYWQPNHADSKFRSNVNRTLLLIQIGEHYVPVGQNGVKEYNMIKGESDSSSINSVLVAGEESSKNAVVS